MRKRYVIAAVLTVVAVVGTLFVGSATAQVGSPGSAGFHDAVWSRAAAILGLPPERLADAFDQAHRQALDDAVATGQLTRQQADWMTQHREAMRRAGGPVAGPWTMGRGMMGRGMMGGRFSGGNAPTWVAR